MNESQNKRLYLLLSILFLNLDLEFTSYANHILQYCMSVYMLYILDLKFALNIYGTLAALLKWAHFCSAQRRGDQTFIFLQLPFRHIQYVSAFMRVFSFFAL